MFIKSKAQKKWMLSLFLVITLLLLIITLLMTWVMHVLSKEITKLNDNLTSLVQISMDTRLKEIEHISLHLERSNANLFLSKLKKANDIQPSIAYALDNQVRNYKLANRLVKHIYIYYPAIDFVVGDLGHFTTKNYYLLLNHLNDSAYIEWKNNVLEKNRNTYDFYGDSLVFTRRLSHNAFAEATAYLVIHIDKTEIESMLESTRSAGMKSIIAMLNAEHNIYASAGAEAADIIKSMPASIFEKEEMDKLGDYFILKRFSTESDMIYMTIVDQAELLSLAYNIRNMVYLVLLGCLIGGFCISLYVSKVNYKPLSSLLSKVKDSEDESIDEYHLISQKIDTFINENTRNSIRLEEQQAAIENIFITHVLQSEHLNSQSIFAAMQKLDIEFLGSQYAVMLIRSLPHSAMMAISLIQLKDMPYFFISAEFQGDRVLLINVENEVSQEDLVAFASRIYSENKESILALGGLYDSLSDIVTSYHQALKAAEGAVHNKSGVYVYDARVDNTKSIETSREEAKKQFFRYMDIQNYVEAQALLGCLLGRNLSKEENTFLSRCRRYTIIDRVLNEMVMAALANPKIKVDQHVSQLSISLDPEELLLAINKMLDVLMEHHAKTANGKNEGVAQRARHIIEKDYTDPMLGLYSISEQLGVSNTYLSKVFKDTYGQGLVQYINQQRIEQAKSLILSTALSVKEVASLAGFSSDVSFIRVFKQYTNTTPGKYKKQ